MPLRVWVMDWPSATLNAYVFQIVAQEILGYNVDDLGYSLTADSGLWAIVGCEDFGCELEDGHVSTAHFNFETYDYYLFSALERIAADYPEKGPVQIGTVGYTAFEGNYFKKSVLNEAIEQAGLGLDTFRGYNVSWKEPAAFFDAPSEVDAAVANLTTIGYEHCSSYSPFNDPQLMQSYVDLFGDVDGTQTVDGVLQGACVDNVWWASPQCREDLSACVPYVTTAGWGIIGMMHKAMAYDMPIATASLPDFDEWVVVVSASRVTAYWWVPDVSFIALDMQSIIFPAYDAEKHNNGDFTTEFALVQLEKWAHPKIETAANDVWETASNMEITINQMDNMLMMYVESSQSLWDVACEFLRTEQPYEAWIPSATACLDGQGLNAGVPSGHQQRAPREH